MITAAQAHATAVTSKIQVLKLGYTVTSINEMIVEAASKGSFSVRIALYTKEQKDEFADVIKADRPHLIYERPLVPFKNESDEEDEDTEDDFDDDDEETVVSYEESTHGSAIADYYRLHGYGVSFPVRSFYSHEPVDYTYRRSYELLCLDWDGDTVTGEELYDVVRSTT